MNKPFTLCSIVLISILFLLLPYQQKNYAEEIKTDENIASTVLILLDGVGTGSGFVISDHHVVTNHHVVYGYEEGIPVYIILNEEDYLEARVIWSSETKDLAVLETSDPLNLPIVSFSNDSDVEVKDTVYAMGFPGAALDGIDSSALTTVKVTKGIISAKVQSEDGVRLYQTDAPINPGNSGGPLFSEWGTVIGVNSSASLIYGMVLDENGDITSERIRKGDNINWAIQVEELLVELDALDIPYTLIPKPVDSGWETTDIILIGVASLAVLLAASALIFAITKKGKVVVQEVTKRFISEKPKVNIPMSPPTNQKFSSKNQPEQIKTLTKPYLMGITGQYRGQKFPLHIPISIGRNAKVCQLVINAQEISAKHCVVSFDSKRNQFFLLDNGSSNGTFLESGEKVPINVKQYLNPSQKFYLSNSNHLFEVRLEESI